MCLILAKPAGIKLSDRFYEIVRAGALVNDHGSGYMFRREKGKTIHLHKGFFPGSVEGMIADIQNSNIGKNDFLVVHNRMATSGYRNVANCHPFPITEKDDLLKSDTLLSELACVAHNGMFGEFSRMSKNNSDTYMFVKTFLATSRVMDYKKGIQWLAAKIGWNKLAALHPEFGIILVGEFKKDHGFFVSNTFYKHYLNDKTYESEREQQYSEGNFYL